MKIKEIDLLVVMGLTIFFMTAIWGIDVSFGAVFVNGIVRTIHGPQSPLDFYHANMVYAQLSFILTISWFSIRIHYDEWKKKKLFGDLDGKQR